MAYTYDRLDPEAVHQTCQRLQQRIADRFVKERGLQRVATDLVGIVKDVGGATEYVVKRRRGTRVATRLGILIVLAVAGIVFALAVRSAVEDAPDSGLEWLPLLESAVNDVIFAVLAIWFLWSVPERLERQTLLAKLYRLRSLAHIVDMHQLSKDVAKIRSSPGLAPEPESDDLSPEMFQDYLDYCSELLSLVGKAAALCAEESRDPLVLDTVSTIETLTVSLERKVWQKIAVLDTVRSTGPAT